MNTLSCSLHGQPITLVHVTGKTKPFERQWWVDQGRSPYPALLRRLLVKRDVRVQVARDVPMWVRPGRLGEVVIRILYLVNEFGRIREWLRKWRLLRWAYKSLRGQLSGTHV